MSAKTYVIVDDTTDLPVGLYTCDSDPELAATFGGYNQHLVDDPLLVAQVVAQAEQAAADRREAARLNDPFAIFTQ